MRFGFTGIAENGNSGLFSVTGTGDGSDEIVGSALNNLNDPLNGTPFPVDIPGMPIKWSRLPNNIPLDAPTLGQHNEVILTEMLGRSAEDIDALSRDGVLFSRNC